MENINFIKSLNWQMDGRFMFLKIFGLTNPRSASPGVYQISVKGLNQLPHIIRHIIEVSA